MYDAKARIGNVEDVHCPACNHLTAHTIRDAYDTTWDVPDIIRGGAVHDFLRCNGCGAGTYRVREWTDEDQERREPTYYPPRGDHIRAVKDWPNIPLESKIVQVYKQTIDAFNGDARTLAGAGVRLLIEGVCRHKRITDGPLFDRKTGRPRLNGAGAPARGNNLEGKINGLAERNFISKIQMKHLHQLRFLGNDAAHQLDIPEASVLNHAIDIAEHILNQVYEQPRKAKAIRVRKRRQ